MSQAANQVNVKIVPYFSLAGVSIKGPENNHFLTTLKKIKSIAFCAIDCLTGGLAKSMESLFGRVTEVIFPSGAELIFPSDVKSPERKFDSQVAYARYFSNDDLSPDYASDDDKTPIQTSSAAINDSATSVTTTTTSSSTGSTPVTTSPANMIEYYQVDNFDFGFDPESQLRFQIELLQNKLKIGEYPEGLTQLQDLQKQLLTIANQTYNKS